MTVEKLVGRTETKSSISHSRHIDIFVEICSGQFGNMFY